jgi:hypothetical protein
VRLRPDSAALHVSFDELRELARRRLGRALTFGVTPHVVVLADVLAAGEVVLDIAWIGEGRGGLLVATPPRILEISTGGTDAELGRQLDLERVLQAELDEDRTLVVRHDDGALRWTGLVPAQRGVGLLEIVQRRAA